MDSRIGDLRRGKVKLKNLIDETSDYQLYENQCLYTTYAVHLRHRKERKHQLEQGLQFNSSDSWRDPKKQEQGQSKKKGEGTTKTDACTMQVRTLNQNLQLSHKSLYALDRPKEREEPRQEDNSFKSLGDFFRIKHDKSEPSMN